MQKHTTNYCNAFIVIADDCPTTTGELPPQKGDNRTAANIQFEMISNNPYRYTSDEVLFEVYALKNDLTAEERDQAWMQFFSKGQACFRASPLTKRYGWGVHFDEAGKMAIYSSNSPEYARFSTEAGIKVFKAMKSNR